MTGHIGRGIRSSMQGKGYGKEILRLAILEAAKRGFNDLLLCGSSGYIASWKVIEANGGRFESESYHRGTGTVVRLYRIAY